MEELQQIIDDATQTLREQRELNERLSRLLYEEQREHEATKRYYEERIQQITQRMNVLPPL